MERSPDNQQFAPNNGEILLYNPDDTIRLEVRMNDETVWLTQQQIADLFGVNQPAISKHIANIYKSGELDENGTYSILEYMGNDGKQLYKTKFYNLDVILSLSESSQRLRRFGIRQCGQRFVPTYHKRRYRKNNKYYANQRQQLRCGERPCQRRVSV